MSVEQKKNKLIEDLVYQNGQLNCKLSQKNIKIAEKIKNLTISRQSLIDEYKDYPNFESLLRTIDGEIIWLKELADI